VTNRILLVEDDPHLGYILKEYLQMHNFEVALAVDGEAGSQAFRKNTYDLIILDVMLPKKDGFTLAEEIKSIAPASPIIFLTAKSLKVDKLKGFKLGGDDYLVKPVDEEELIARIQAVLKRSKGAPLSGGSFNIGQFIFDPKGPTLQSGDSFKRLTQMESKLLQILCESAGHVVESDLILKTLWGKHDYFTRRSMDVFISRLRRYLHEDPTIRITNLHSKGYILETVR